MKKILSLVLVLSLVVGCLMGMSVTTYAATEIYDDFREDTLNSTNTENGWIEAYMLPHIASERTGSGWFKPSAPYNPFSHPDMTAGARHYQINGSLSFTYQGDFSGSLVQFVVGAQDATVQSSYWSKYSRDIFKPDESWKALKQFYCEGRTKIYAGATREELVEVPITGWYGGNASNHTFVSAIVETLPANTNFVRVEYVGDWTYTINSVLITANKNAGHIMFEEHEMEDYNPPVIDDKESAHVTFNEWPSGTDSGNYVAFDQSWNGSGFYESKVTTSNSFGSGTAIPCYWNNQLTFYGKFGGKKLEVVYAVSSDHFASGTYAQNDLGVTVPVNGGNTIALVYPRVDPFTAWVEAYRIFMEGKLTITATDSNNNIVTVPVSRIIGNNSNQGAGSLPAVGLIVDELPADTRIVQIKMTSDWENSVFKVVIDDALEDLDSGMYDELELPLAPETSKIAYATRSIDNRVLIMIESDSTKSSLAGTVLVAYYGAAGKLIGVSKQEVYEEYYAEAELNFEMMDKKIPTETVSAKAFFLDGVDAISPHHAVVPVTL